MARITDGQEEALVRIERNWNPLYIGGGNVKWCSFLRKHWKFPQNAKHSYQMTQHVHS